MYTTSMDARMLFAEGNLVLSRMSQTGMRIDRGYLESVTKLADDKIREHEAEVRACPAYKDWQRLYGEKTNIASPTQIARLIFKEYGHTYKPVVFTDSEERESASEKALEHVDHPLVKAYFRASKFRRLRGTYLGGIFREMVEWSPGIWLIHPSFNLNTVKTFRSSCTRPNVQNQYKRDPEFMELMRRVFIPRPGRQNIEIDYCFAGGTEVETITGTMEISEVARSVAEGRAVHVYGYDSDKQRICVSRVLGGGLIKKKAKVFKLTLDNGESVVATPDHKFMLRNGQWSKLEDLKEGDSLMPFYKELWKSPWRTNYHKIYLNNGKWIKAHNLIALDVLGKQIGKGSDLVVHHKNGKGTDNSLDNIEVMNRREHMRIHSKQGWTNPFAKKDRHEWSKTEAGKAHIKKMHEAFKNLSPERKAEMRRRQAETKRRNGSIVGENNPMFGKTQSQETRDKIAATKKGKKTGKSWNRGQTKETNESVRRISEAHKKIPFPKPFRGPFTEEHRRKISEACKGRVISEEAKKKQAESMKAYWAANKHLRTVSEETKRRTSESLRKRYAKHPFAKLTEEQTRRLVDLMSSKPQNMSQYTFVHLHASEFGISPDALKATIRRLRKHHNHQVVSVEFYGYEDVYCIEVENIHNFAIAAGVIVKNCQNEVMMAARYTLDPNALAECNDPTKDPHRDTACRLFFLKPNEVTKTVRNIAKSPFVFAQFFGDYYVNCTINIWHALQDTKNVMVKDSTETILDRLAKNGITRRGLCSSKEKPIPGTFEAHVKSVEDWYWLEKYPVHTAWKKSWWENYQNTGGCITKVGFAVNDVRVRNEIINLPIQCDAFQCLLWSIIRLSKIFRKYKMDVLMIDEVHDSLNSEVYPKDREDYIEISKRVMTEDIVKAWPWLEIVPPRIEVEACPIDGAWADKMELIRSGDVWEPKDSEKWSENFGLWV